jgi:hypothetical protein
MVNGEIVPWMASGRVTREIRRRNSGARGPFGGISGAARCARGLLGRPRSGAGVVACGVRCLSVAGGERVRVGLSGRWKKKRRSGFEQVRVGQGRGGALPVFQGPGGAARVKVDYKTKSNLVATVPGVRSVVSMLRQHPDRLSKTAVRTTFISWWRVDARIQKVDARIRRTRMRASNGCAGSAGVQRTDPDARIQGMRRIHPGAAHP